MLVRAFCAPQRLQRVKPRPRVVVFCCSQVIDMKERISSMETKLPEHIKALHASVNNMIAGFNALASRFHEVSARMPSATPPSATPASPASAPPATPAPPSDRSRTQSEPEPEVAEVPLLPQPAAEPAVAEVPMNALQRLNASKGSARAQYETAGVVCAQFLLDCMAVGSVRKLNMPSQRVSDGEKVFSFLSAFCTPDETAALKAQPRDQQHANAIASAIVAMACQRLGQEWDKAGAQRPSKLKDGGAGKVGVNTLLTCLNKVPSKPFHYTALSIQAWRNARGGKRAAEESVEDLADAAGSSAQRQRHSPRSLGQPARDESSEGEPSDDEVEVVEEGEG